MAPLPLTYALPAHKMEAPSFVSKARTALHSAAAKAERVITDIKSDLKSDRGSHFLFHNSDLFIALNFPFFFLHFFLFFIFYFTFFFLLYFILFLSNRKLNGSIRFNLVDSDKQSSNSKISEPELSKKNAEVKVDKFFLFFSHVFFLSRSWKILFVWRETEGKS